MLRPDQLVESLRDKHGEKGLVAVVHNLEHEGLPEEHIEEAAEIIRQDTVDLGDKNPAVLSCEILALQFGTDMATGMTSKDAENRLKEEGLNDLEKPPKLGFFALFLLQMTSFIIILLVLAALASILVNATSSRRGDPLQYTTGIAIFILVILNAGIAAWTESQAGNALDKLQEMQQAEVPVIRDGKEQSIKTIHLVRGDVVLLKTGNVVPADIRLFEAADVKVDEKALTGEPDDVAKNAKVVPRDQVKDKLNPPNIIFSGCPFVQGTAKGLIIATGMNTELGKIAALITGKKGNSGKKCGCLPDTSDNQTPLQESVEKLGARIGLGACVICVFLFIIGGLLGTTDPEMGGSPWIYMILVSVTLAVAAIPEGIPLCVTISLSIGCKEMAQKMVLVRKIAAVETLGSASVICSDKTGTLTEGKMTMTDLWSCGAKYEISGQGFNPETGHVFSKEAGQTGQGAANSNSDMGVKSTLLAALLCSDTVLSYGMDDKLGREAWQYKGNSSEAPIVVAAHKVGLKKDEVGREYARLLTIPFSSSRKMMLTVSDVTGKTTLSAGGMQLPPSTTKLAVVKGAPNWVLESCTQQLTAGGVTPMSAAERASVNAVVDAYSEQALRVLAVAVNPMTTPSVDLTSEDVAMDEKFEVCKKDLILVGLVASIDPDREGVPESVLKARGAGIRVVMITGDYVKTAIAIAKRVNIIAAEDDIDECACDCNRLRPNGPEYIDSSEVDEMTKRVRCFARAKPEDKLMIVKSLQRQGFVCAMTGDGVNDAPALNEAMIGVAMGEAGTEVAKGAAEMVLQDDNFTRIVDAVEKGRVIYAGIQKFVAFIMSVHIAEVVQIFVCVVAQIPIMRTPLQILFLILVTDLPPSIALGMEPGEANVLKQLPRPRDEPIVVGWMWVSMIVNGILLSAVIIGIYIWALLEYPGVVFNRDFPPNNDDCLGDGAGTDACMEWETAQTYLQHARTIAFISLVFSENVRAYISRSFEKPVWVNFLGNFWMQVAVAAALFALALAVIILPLITERILRLNALKIGWKGWGIAFVGPVATLILCELWKIPTKMMKQRYDEKVRAQQLRIAGEETDSSSDDSSSGSDGL